MTKSIESALDGTWHLLKRSRLTEDITTSEDEIFVFYCDVEEIFGKSVSEDKQPCRLRGGKELEDALDCILGGYTKKVS